MEEQLGVKEGLLEDYRESTSSLRAMVHQMQQEKIEKWEEGDTGTITTGINTSILPGETMSTVQSTITTTSASWLEQITQVCNEHRKAMQAAQLGYTQDLLEQTRENHKRFQKVHKFLVDISRVLVAIVETSMEQVGGCQAEIQGFTINAKNAQRKIEQMIGNLHHEKAQQHRDLETEHEITEEIDEAKKRWYEELEAMEHHRGQHGEDQNESTELVPFSCSGNTDRRENGGDHKKEEEEEETLAPLMEKGEEGGNGREQINAGKREDKEEMMMT